MEFVFVSTFVSKAIRLAKESIDVSLCLCVKSEADTVGAGLIETIRENSVILANGVGTVKIK